MADRYARLANPGRRIFLKVGLVGAGLLAAAGVWRYLGGGGATAPAPGLRYLTVDDREIFAAIAPVILEDALPRAGRGELIEEVLAGVDRIVTSLSRVDQADLRRLLDLLDLAPARLALTGVRSGWADAAPDEVAGFLRRWLESSWPLFNQSYIAFHDLVVAAWYGNPRAWAMVGYDGPPDIPDEVRVTV